MNTQAVPGWQSDIQHKRAVLLNHLLLTAVIGGLVALIMNYFSIREGRTLQEQWAEMRTFFAVWMIVLIPWLWRSLGHNIRAWFSIILAYLLGIFIFWRGGLPGSGTVWMLLPPTMAFVLLGPKPGFYTGLASSLIYAFFAIIFTQTSLEPLIPPLDPTELATWGTEGASFLLIAFIMTLLLWSFSQSWLEGLRQASMANKELEKTNEQLHRQTSQLQAAAEIAHVGSSMLDPEALQTAVVDRLQERFSLMGVYFVGLFLLDETGSSDGAQQAMLEAATGEAGKLLLEMGYGVKVNEATAVGWCIAHQQARLTQGVGGTVQLGTLPMPNTRIEIAMPLNSRGQTIGALSIHSTHEAAFNEDDVAILQTLADQIAVAIDNARLFSQTETALAEVQATQRRYLAQEWREFLTLEQVGRTDYTQPGTEAGDESFLSEARRAAMVHGRTIATSSPSPDPDEAHDAPQTALVVPLKLRGQVIGTMALHETHHQRPWTTEEIALAENVAEQVTLTVENLRLMDETQRRAAHERLLGEISGQMQRATDMETLMRITAEELNRALGGSRAYVRLDTASPQHPSGGDGHTGGGDD